MEWVRGAVVRRAIDLHRRSHREGPQAARATDCVELALRAGREVTLTQCRGECACKWGVDWKVDGTDLEEGETP